jgi:hypothetical protein
MTPERELEIARAARAAETKRADDAEARLWAIRVHSVLAFDPTADGNKAAWAREAIKKILDNVEPPAALMTTLVAALRATGELVGVARLAAASVLNAATRAVPRETRERLRNTDVDVVGLARQQAASAIADKANRIGLCTCAPCKVCLAPRGQEHGRACFAKSADGGGAADDHDDGCPAGVDRLLEVGVANRRAHTLQALREERLSTELGSEASLARAAWANTVLVASEGPWIPRAEPERIVHHEAADYVDDAGTVLVANKPGVNECLDCGARWLDGFEKHGEGCANTGHLKSPLVAAITSVDFDDGEG